MHVKATKNGDMYHIEADEKGYTQILRSVDFARETARDIKDSVFMGNKHGFSGNNKLFNILIKIRNI